MLLGKGSDKGQHRGRDLKQFHLRTVEDAASWVATSGVGCCKAAGRQSATAGTTGCDGGCGESASAIGDVPEAFAAYTAWLTGSSTILNGWSQAWSTIFVAACGVQINGPSWRREAHIGWPWIRRSRSRNWG